MASIAERLLLKSNWPLIAGTVISSRAFLYPREPCDLVVVRHEFALETGIMKLQQFFDSSAPEVTIVGDQVTVFPELPMLKEVVLELYEFELRDGFYQAKGAVIFDGCLNPPPYEPTDADEKAESRLKWSALMAHQERKERENRLNS